MAALQRQLDEANARLKEVEAQKRQAEADKDQVQEDKRRAENARAQVEHMSGLSVIAMDAIRAATQNFDQECRVGGGGFGSVFRCRLNVQGSSRMVTNTLLDVIGAHLKHCVMWCRWLSRDLILIACKALRSSRMRSSY